MDSEEGSAEGSVAAMGAAMEAAESVVAWAVEMEEAWAEATAAEATEEREAGCSKSPACWFVHRS